jgi:hypothetical protein
MPVLQKESEAATGSRHGSRLFRTWRCLLISSRVPIEDSKGFVGKDTLLCPVSWYPS